MKKNPVLILLMILAITANAMAQELDLDRSSGPVKPVNGVGQPPVLSWGNTSLFHYLKEAGIPYSRLHDVGGAFGGNLYVDIPNLFRDFEADENLESSYDFTFTDSLLVGLTRNGVEPYFRLGVTIENRSYLKAYRIHPPSDYGKWARICEHVIRHYNQGWASGYRMGITHWEIWNEPENYEDPIENCMWRGSFDEFMEFYKVTATHLKKAFPDLKIGGYGSCGFYAVTGEGVVAANSSPRYENFVTCFLKFLDRARREQWPLDFFSCHSYAAPDQALRQFEYARKTLDEYGFKDTELSVNEWLPSPSVEKLGSAQQASEIAAMLLGFQNGSVDDAEIYDARATGGTYAPLFVPETRRPRKAYYTYLAFNELRKLGHAVMVPKTGDGIYAAAATDLKGHAAVMIANISAENWLSTFRYPGYRITSHRVINEDLDLKETPLSGTVEHCSVVLLSLEKE